MEMVNEMKTKLRKIHSTFSGEEKYYCSLYDELNHLRVAANCRHCDKEKEYLKLLFEQRYISCKSDKCCMEVVNIAYKIKESDERRKAIREEYARSIYSILNGYQPVLIWSRNKTEVLWNDAFTTSYDKMDESMKASLIGLVEFDGGVYRLKDVEKIF